MKNILWTPLDLPPLPKEITLDNITSLFNYIPNASEEQRKEFAEKRQHYLYAWNSYRLRAVSGNGEQSWTVQNSNNDWQWTADAREQCPKLIEYIETYLPFKKIKAASIMSSTGVVPSHYDMSVNATDEEKRNYIFHEPSLYRLLIDGGIHSNSFYVESQTVPKTFCNLPVDSPGWAMGCYTCLHGNDESTPHQKILLYIMGDLDTEKHTSLITRSVEKYKNYIIETKE